VTVIAPTFRRGEPGPGGWCHLIAGPPVRHDQPPADGEPVAAFWHLTDPHICDAESPARLEYLDRYGDADSPFAEELGEVGTYRPHEILTVPLLSALLTQLRATPLTPVTGTPATAVILTGDGIDNGQANEWSWLLAALAGGPVAAASGNAAASEWVGAHGVPFDERYWHPDGGPDLPRIRYGYPSVPGLVEAARGVLHSPGSPLPVHLLPGNHDLLLQGTVPFDDDCARLAVGGERIVGLPVGAAPLLTAAAIPECGPARYVHDRTSPRIAVTADARRSLGRPDVAGDRVVPLAGLTLVILDTVNPHGGWNGSLTTSQLRWCEAVLTDTAAEDVIIVTHHPTPAMTNTYAPGDAESRVPGEELRAVLGRHPHVIAHLAGHVHRHAAVCHQRPTGGAGASRVGLPVGWWELTTASLIDWPQQVRLLEVVRERVGGEPALTLISTAVDHAGLLDWREAPLTDACALAGLARELSANDYHDRARALPAVTSPGTAAPIADAGTGVFRLRDWRG